MTSLLDRNYKYEEYADVLIVWMSSYGCVGRATTPTGRLYDIYYHAVGCIYSCSWKHGDDRQEFTDQERLKVYLAHH